MERINPYSLYAQFVRKQNQQIDQFNKERLLNKMSPLYDDKFNHEHLRNYYDLMRRQKMKQFEEEETGVIDIIVQA